MNRILTIIFGNPDLNKIGLFVRGFIFAIIASSLGALLYLLNQWAGNVPIDWTIAKQVFAYNVVPTLGLWFAALKAWLTAQSAVSIEELNKMLEIGIKLPAGSKPEDAIAIYENTKGGQGE